MIVIAMKVGTKPIQTNEDEDKEGEDDYGYV